MENEQDRTCRAYTVPKEIREQAEKEGWSWLETMAHAVRDPDRDIILP